ncbi:HIT family protein [uncultured Thiodictyon sp.]|jgi:histidine triad (HIT) family protein|uniref:HIT family protein n=1 Tax=uncultured Thiodictyon sp. TaxID=1846217 RepID=UPI0025EF4855|nr:HIT family protein [uncultured Thiodictyon sp.]
MSDHTNCVFCGIVRGDIPAIRVHEDAETLAFMDIQPASPGHTLVIPKIHAPDLLAIAEADLCAVTIVAQRIARAVHQALAPDGIRIMQTNGAAAGQTVFHYHVHIIPMQDGQRIGTHGHEQAQPEQLKALAARIAAALRS